MTAVNVLVYLHAAVLFTDTKTTNAERQQYNLVKVAPMPWLRTVVAVRGYVGALRVFERAISSRAHDFNSALQFLCEGFEDILNADYADETELHAMKQDLDVYIVGWGAGGPAANWISNYRPEKGMQRIHGCHISPMVDRHAQARFSADVKLGMPQLMADQARQNPGVGGWIVATEVTETMITTYPLGGICPLSSQLARMQPVEEVAALQRTEEYNRNRTARRLSNSEEN